jgi:putative phosphoesterase
MKFLVISDIHGAMDAFNLAETAFKNENADYFVCCGDYLYHGPRNMLPIGYDPADLAPVLNRHKDKILAVRGNCDSEVDQMLLDFPMMSNYLIFFSNGRRFFVTHGHLYTDDTLPPLSPGDVVISGHTHVPVLEQRNNLIFLNPGSTTIPKSQSKPGYAIIDDNSIALKNLLDGTEIKRLELP